MNLLVLFAPSRLLKPILDRAGVKPRIVEGRPNKPPRSRKVAGGGGRARPGRRKKNRANKRPRDRAGNLATFESLYRLHCGHV